MAVAAPGAQPRTRVPRTAAPMRAARLHAFGEPLSVDHVVYPAPRGHEVLLRVAAAGVSGLDVELAGGLLPGMRLPAVLGHEVAGVVEAAGPQAQGVVPGTAVLVHGAWGCGVCAACRSGQEQLCPRRRWCGLGAPGGFAEHLLVPHPRHLVGLARLDPVRATPLGGAGLWAYRAVRRALDRLVPGTAAVVVGTGPSGQMAVQMLKALSAVHVIAVRPEGRRDGAARESGADAVVCGLVPGEVREALEHRPARAVIDTVGSDASLALAAAVVAPQGRVVACGLGRARLAWPLEGVAAEAALTTSWWGSRADLVEVLALAEAGRIFMRTEPFALGEAAAALRAVEQGVVDGRAVLVP